MVEGFCCIYGTVIAMKSTEEGRGGPALTDSTTTILTLVQHKNPLNPDFPVSLAPPTLTHSDSLMIRSLLTAEDQLFPIIGRIHCIRMTLVLEVSIFASERMHRVRV